MKLAFLFVFLALIGPFAVQAACNFDNQEEFIAAISAEATAVGTACADLTTVTCGEDGECWDALSDYYAFIESCVNEFEGTDLSSFSAIVDTIRDQVCAALEEINDLITSVLECVADENLTNDLQQAALNVVEECSALNTNQVCTEECKDAIVDYNELLLKCYDLDSTTEDEALAALRGSLDTFCQFYEPVVACQQTVSRQLIKIQDKCTPDLEDNGVLVCEGECSNAIQNALSFAEEECADFASDLVDGWVELCESCGADAYSAVYRAVSVCREVDWENISECPESCSDAIDNARTAVDCFPQSNMVKRAAEAFFRLKEAACNNGNLQATCFAEAQEGHWDDLIEHCLQDNACSASCRKEVQDFKARADECFDGITLDGDLETALEAVEDFCTGGQNRRYFIELVLNNWTIEQVLENFDDFIRRVSLATGIPIEELILIALEEYEDEDGKRAGETSVSLASDQAPKEDSDLQEYGIDGQVRAETTGDDDSANQMAVPALLALASVVAAAVF